MKSCATRTQSLAHGSPHQTSIGLSNKTTDPRTFISAPRAKFSTISRNVLRSLFGIILAFARFQRGQGTPGRKRQSSGEVGPWTRNERDQALDQFVRREYERGRAIAPGTLELELLRRFIRDAVHEKVQDVPDVPLSGASRTTLQPSRSSMRSRLRRLSA